MSRLGRLGLLMNATMLGLGASLLVVLPTRRYDIALFGRLTTIRISAPWQIGILLALLTCTGVESIVRTYPEVVKRGLPYSFSFWSLPTALTLGAVAMLQQYQSPPLRIGVLAVSGVFLGVCVRAQCRWVEAGDALRGGARIVLAPLTYVVAFVLFFAMHGAESRGLLSAAGTFLAGMLLSLELLRRTGARTGRMWLHAAVVGLLMGQVSWALNYWSMSRIQRGLVLLLVLHFLAGISEQDLSNRLSKRLVIEYAVTALVGLAAIWLYATWIP